MHIRTSSTLSLKGRALRLLAQREYSRHELERKLSSHETFEGELQAALDDLAAKGFINEARVVESVLHRKAHKLGASRVRMALQDKGLPKDMITQAVDGLKDSEFARAQDVWQRKFGAPPTSPEARGKQMRFLASRGFGGDVISKVLRAAKDIVHEEDAA